MRELVHAVVLLSEGKERCSPETEVSGLRRRSAGPTRPRPRPSRRAPGRPSSDRSAGPARRRRGRRRRPGSARWRSGDRCRRRDSSSSPIGSYDGQQRSSGVDARDRHGAGEVGELLRLLGLRDPVEEGLGGRLDGVIGRGVDGPRVVGRGQRERHPGRLRAGTPGRSGRQPGAAADRRRRAIPGTAAVSDVPPPSPG